MRATVLSAGLLLAAGAHAQRASENAVAEASDAFGTAVGREVIGLYTTTSARGFSPSQAGNLRIAGLYFDQIPQANPVARIVRGSTVHVGISAQGFPFPAPTGVVDFQLRTPGEVFGASTLVGIQSYNQEYLEVDAQAPIVAEALSVGAGFGYSRNASYTVALSSDDWNAGAIAHWQPSERLSITPFWSTSSHREVGEKPNVFIGNNGVPRYRGANLPVLPGADWGSDSGNSGVLARYALSDRWLLETGVFRSESISKTNHPIYLYDLDGDEQTTFSVAEVPPRHVRSTSGEARLLRKFDTETVRNSLYLSVKGRDRSSESGGADQHQIGPATTTSLPQFAPIEFHTGPTTRVEVRQVTPAVAYEGVWRGVGQLSLGVQKSYYDRTIDAPAAAQVSSRSEPWLYNAAAGISLTPQLIFYTSATRGFEEIADAPSNSINRDLPVPAQLTRQVDAGVRYRFTSSLQLVAGGFQIDKPYFDLDRTSFYRQVGTISNRGLEFSLSGAPIERLTVVAGYIYIQPTVQYDAELTGRGSAVAIGPIPGLLRANVQYRSRGIPGLIFDTKIESTSSRYARYPSVSLPAVTTLDMGARYNTHLFGKPSTWHLQLYNLTGEYSLTPSPSGQLTPLEGRRFELSLAIDI